MEYKIARRPSIVRISSADPVTDSKHEYEHAQMGCSLDSARPTFFRWRRIVRN